MRGQKGITLVALVVTIVVLLILAGITITYVLSDGGIIQKAKEADKATELAAIRDYMQLASIDALAEKYAPTTGASGNKTALEVVKANFPTSYNVVAGDPAVAMADGKLTGKVKVTVGTNVYTVDFTTNEVTGPAAE